MREEFNSQKPMVKPVSKGLYLSLGILGSIGNYVFGVLATLSAFSIFLPGFSIFSIFTYGKVALFSILAVASGPIGEIAYLVLLYKAWASIQDGYARTSPGKAVGFMFIPFFSLYWIFPSQWGFAVDYNKYVDRNNLNVPHLSEGLFLALPILTLIYIPLVTPIIRCLVIGQMCDGINNLVSAPVYEPSPIAPPPVEPTIPERVTPSSFAFLIAEAGPLVGQTFKLIQRGSYVVGRAGDISIPPEDKTVSREHARIRDENGKFVLYDMGSTNHTYVNKERVDRKVLLDGDKIKIGQTVFRFQWVRRRQ